MNAARLKWIALMAAFAVLTHLATTRTRTVREYATSARVYWRADQALASVTTAAEIRDEGVVSGAFRKLRVAAKIAPAAPELHIGSTHVYVFRNGAWQDNAVNPARSLKSSPLWPYDGTFYTWDDSKAVRQWKNGILATAPPDRAKELRQAFPDDANNYLAANAAHPYAILQDAITRDEWHAYENLAAMPDGKALPFTVGGKAMQAIVRRDPANNEFSLSIRQGGELLPLWQAQPAPRSVSRMELLDYLSARPLSQLSFNDRQRDTWIDFAGTLLVLLLLWAVFLRPLLLTSVPPSIQFVDASEDEFPNLDHVRWSEYSERLEALGFVHVRDVKIANMLHAGISRVYLHPDSNCYGTVFQAFAPNAPGMLFGLLSYIGEDWTVGHGVLAPTPGSAVNRLPHRLAFSRPGSSVEELYQEHIATRDQIAAGLGLRIVTPVGFETYQQRSDLDAAARRSSVGRNPFVLACKVYLAKLRPLSNDWWGDYPKEFQSLTGQKFVANEV